MSSCVYPPLACALFVGAAAAALAQTGAEPHPLKVTIHEAKTESEPADLPVETTPRITVGYSSIMFFGFLLEGKLITNTPNESVFVSAKVDGDIVGMGENVVFGGFGGFGGGLGALGGPGPFPGIAGFAGVGGIGGIAGINGAMALGGGFSVVPQPLPPGLGNKQRLGTTVSWPYKNVVLTREIEIVPGRLSEDARPGEKLKLDTCRILYRVENKDTRPHEVGLRTLVDTHIVENDGALFASPTTHPGKILDGVKFLGKDIPPYLRVLERPSLSDPGLTATMTLRFTGRSEGPNEVALTTMRSIGEWNEGAVAPANGDSGVLLFWDVKTLKPGEKREMVWGYGGRLAPNPETDGAVSLVFGGNFEPGKSFSIMAYIDEPVEGQSLTLHLPDGMTLLEGSPIQPVPAPLEGTATSVLLWKVRVERLGEFPLRVISSGGVAQTRMVSVSRE